MGVQGTRPIDGRGHRRHPLARAFSSDPPITMLVNATFIGLPHSHCHGFAIKGTLLGPIALRHPMDYKLIED